MLKNEIRIWLMQECSSKRYNTQVINRCLYLIEHGYSPSSLLIYCNDELYNLRYIHSGSFDILAYIAAYEEVVKAFKS